MKAQAVHTYYPQERDSHRQARVRAGRHDRLGAQARSIVEHREIVYNLAYRILGDTELATATTESTFLTALTSLSQSRQPSPQLWLLKIAFVVWQQHLVGPEPSSGPRDTSPRGSRQEALAEIHDSRPRDDGTQALLNALPPEQRVTLVLSDIGGLSYRDIAEVTGVSVDLVRSRLSQARTALRDSLLKHGLLPPGALSTVAPA